MLFGFTPSRCRSGGITGNKMNNQILFTFGDNDQYEVIEARCVECQCDLMFIQAKNALSLPVCEACVPIVRRQIKESLKQANEAGKMIDLALEYDIFYTDTADNLNTSEEE